MIPESIGRYEVQCLLGEGAFGQVFAACDTALGRNVAIKLLRTMYARDASFMARFRAEAASLAALSHPNITAIYDLVEDVDQNGMVMELVHGHTLEHVLQQTRRLPLPECLAVTAQATAGLEYIHRLGIVHRDIKPANLMLTSTGVLKIMDFGIARLQGSTRLTHDGSAVGTLAYAAPEQIKRDEGTPVSDQYSLACMIYEMLSGNPPFDAATEFELMQAQISAAPPPISTRVEGIPAEIDRALLKALSKSPQDRFGSVEEFATALGVRAIQAEAPQILCSLVERTGAVPPMPERKFPAASRDKRRMPAKPALVRPADSGNRTPFLVMGAAVGVALAVGAFIVLDQSSKPSVSPVMVAEAPLDTKPPQPASRSPDLAPQSAAGSASPPDRRSVERQEVAVVPVAPPPPASVAKPAKSPPPRPVAERAPQSAWAADDANSKPVLDLAPNGGREPTVDQLESFVAVPRETAKPETAPREGRTPQRMPKEAPTYQGKVEDWIGGNLLNVQSPTGGVKKVDLSLYGIIGRDDSAKDAAAVRGRLEAFAKGRGIKCWLRQEDGKTKNICFLDGTDIALWALEQGLVKPSKGAPPEYLAVRK